MYNAHTNQSWHYTDKTVMDLKKNMWYEVGINWLKTIVSVIMYKGLSPLIYY